MNNRKIALLALLAGCFTAIYSADQNLANLKGHITKYIDQYVPENQRADIKQLLTIANTRDQADQILHAIVTHYVPSH